MTCSDETERNAEDRDRLAHNPEVARVELQGAPLSRRCHMSGDTTGDGRGRLWMIVAGHVPLLRQQATHRDGTARTVNPSANAYTGSNPVPATHVRPPFEGA